MKKLLLISLLIPNLVMAENVLYCQDVLSTGLIKKMESGTRLLLNLKDTHISLMTITLKSTALVDQ